MAEKETNYSRRQFVKTAGLVGMGAAFLGCSRSEETSKKASGDAATSPGKEAMTEAPSTPPRSGVSTAGEMPTRAFGKTGVQVPILALGGIHDYTQSQLVLNQAVKMGVTYWDTSERYVNGKSEEGMGMYFEKFPEDRKKVFLVTKSGAGDPDGLTKSLDESLQRLKTSYVELFFLHGIDNAEKALTPEVKQWAEKTRSEGKIKYFGFSTHANVEDNLETAAKLGWIDGIMMAYSFRVMDSDRMKAAVDACTKAGIGLTAMKTQAKMPSFGPMPAPAKPMDQMTDEERQEMMEKFAKMREDAEKAPPDELSMNMTERFRNKGFSMEQAKLKLIWDNPAVATICSAMYNMAVLKQNVEAAKGNVQLSRNDKDLFVAYAACTTNMHCPGCTRHCEVGLEKDLPIGVVMRSLMYANSYGDRDLGKTTYRELPSDVRKAIPGWDFTAAERRCPNKLPIGKLMREASAMLA